MDEITPADVVTADPQELTEEKFERAIDLVGTEMKVFIDKLALEARTLLGSSKGRNAEAAAQDPGSTGKPVKKKPTGDAGPRIRRRAVNLSGSAVLGASPSSGPTQWHPHGSIRRVEISQTS